MATAKGRRRRQQQRAKIGVAARCGHRPGRCSSQDDVRCWPGRHQGGHHSKTPRSADAGVSQCRAGEFRRGPPLRRGTRAGGCMCREASVSSSIGAAVGRHASAPKISTPMNSNGAERDASAGTARGCFLGKRIDANRALFSRRTNGLFAGRQLTSPYSFRACPRTRVGAEMRQGVAFGVKT